MSFHDVVVTAPMRVFYGRLQINHENERPKIDDDSIAMASFRIEWASDQIHKLAY